MASVASDASDDPSRRRFLKVATCAIGGGVGLAAAAPALRLFAAPAGETTVVTPTAPIDVGAAASFAVGAAPTKVQVIAPALADAWTTQREVVLGAAWIQRTSPQQLSVLSAVCPHLGCFIDFTGKQFLCPCHDSGFEPSGKRLSGGKAKRDMDALAWEIVDGRVRITWARFAQDTAEKIPT